MSDIKDIDDFRSPEYWREEAKKSVPDTQIVSFTDLEKSSDDHIAFMKFYNLIEHLHEQGTDIEDIFVGGLRALISKASRHAADDYQWYRMFKLAHDELTRADDTPCYQRLGIDDVT